MHIRKFGLGYGSFFRFSLLLFLSPFFSLPFLFIAGFVAPFIAYLSRGISFSLTSQESDKFNLQRVVGK